MQGSGKKKAPPGRRKVLPMMKVDRDGGIRTVLPDESGKRSESGFQPDFGTEAPEGTSGPSTYTRGTRVLMLVKIS
jgi:hypothetical protein